MIREIYNALQPLLIDEPMDEYQAKTSQHLSGHKLSDFRDDSPAYYKAGLDGKLKPFDTVAYAQGRAAHTLILEGLDVYDQTYTIGGPINPKTQKPYGRDTKKFEDWCDENSLEAEFVLTQIDHDLTMQMYGACYKNPEIIKILKEGVAEKVIRANYHGVDCQIRPDWISPTYGFVNLKTCQDLNQFEREARYKYNYIGAEAFYRSVAHAALPEMPEIPCVFVAVEKRIPYRAAVFEISPYLLDDYESKNCDAIERLIECRKTDIWPSCYEGMNLIKERE